MSAAALHPLAERFGLDAPATHALAILAAALADDPLAPTTVRTPEGIRDDHLADSLVGLELEVIRAATTIVDIGAGAGLPGLVLAAARPDAHVIEVEANNRKCEFMRRTAAAMGLDNVEVRHARAEELPDLRNRVDVVTARALAPIGVLAEYAAPLLRPGGHLAAWKGVPEPEVEAEAHRAGEILGLSELFWLQVRPYPAAEQRFLYLMSKVSPTPERFPRRPGMARKRPLGTP